MSSVIDQVAYARYLNECESLDVVPATWERRKVGEKGPMVQEQGHHGAGTCDSRTHQARMGPRFSPFNNVFSCLLNATGVSSSNFNGS
jgi:hypothetical protein